MVNIENGENGNLTKMKFPAMRKEGLEKAEDGKNARHIDAVMDGRQETGRIGVMSFW